MEQEANGLPAAGGGEVVYPFEFRGRAGEYFKIWAVNLLLTVVTLGVFSAWAKVRSRRYFYGNTFLDGANFEYHARPLSILLSRVVLLLLFAGGLYWAGEDVFRNATHSLLLAVFLPWAFVRGLAFNARYSSYRNVRFSYAKENRAYLRAYLIYLPFIFFVLMQYLFALGVRFTDVQWLLFGQQVDSGVVSGLIVGGTFLLLVALLPWLVRAFHRLKAVYHRWGRLRFDAAPRAIGLYMVACWVVPLGTFVLMVGMVVAALFVIGVDGDFESVSVGYIAGAVLLSYVFAALLFSLALVQVFKLFWQGLTLPGGGRVLCDFGAMEFALKIVVVNYFAVIFSLGLLYPWTRVRKTRYLAQHMRLALPAGTMDGMFSEAGGEGAFGEEFEAAEGFDFDLGLI